MAPKGARQPDLELFRKKVFKNNIIFLKTFFIHNSGSVCRVTRAALSEPLLLALGYFWTPISSLGDAHFCSFYLKPLWLVNTEKSVPV